MSGIEGLQERLIEALSHRASLCSVIFKAWATIGTEVGVCARDLTTVSHLSHADEVGTSEILTILSGLGVLEGSAPRWKPTANLAANLQGMATIFGAIEVYRSRVQKNATEVEIIATRPGRAVALDRELSSAGWQTPHPEVTDESISHLFAGATRSIVVMTPFLDQQGGSILKSLLGRVRKDVEITLILRYLDRRSARTTRQASLLFVNGFVSDKSECSATPWNTPSTGLLRPFTRNCFSLTASARISDPPT
jgi:hypothetical protein